MISQTLHLIVRLSYGVAFNATHQSPNQTMTLPCRISFFYQSDQSDQSDPDVPVDSSGHFWTPFIDSVRPNMSIHCRILHQKVRSYLDLPTVQTFSLFIHKT